MPDNPHDTPQQKRHAVLDVFGLKLEVSNPRLAELLTMDAKDALAADIRVLNPRAETSQLRAGDLAEALPETVISMSSPHDQEITRARKAFRERVAAAGQALGFDTHADGLWVSSTGIRILTRTADRPLSLAAATHFVGEMSLIHQQRDDMNDCSVLFVVCDQQTADVFKVAIRQRRMYSIMRTASIDHLEEMRSMMRTSMLDHVQATTLLAPVANIDVGEMMAVLHAQSTASELPTDAL
ncbi:MAG: hypothetical protein CVT66_03165 [Actinobacteria bacterium HGW-Actinobacteria-6]|jgi:predicted ABC-type ATPase|nr:MAG: hypothetical protein CVT66_03165 [Actinobacteria bacterium HGW-Actinobacteria-6]